VGELPYRSDQHIPKKILLPERKKGITMSKNLMSETPLIELEMQELEALESPGFWTGVSIGTAISASVAASVTVT
jgi:hypothetical protein